MTWMQRLFAEPTAEIEVPRAPAQIIPPDQVGVDGGYDVAGLARRVATAYDHAPDVAAIGTVWIEQVGTTLFLRGSAPNERLRQRLIDIAMQQHGVTKVFAEDLLIGPEDTPIG